MSSLVAIAYPNRAAADQVRRTLIELQKEHVIELDDMVVITRSGDGKVKLHQSTSVAAVGDAGALWGGLIGLLFLVDDTLMKQLATKLEEGGAAVILLIRKSTPDKVVPRIKEYGGHMLQTSLSEEQEESLRAALEEPVSA
jgi:uncharacterized membrane protein